MSRIFLNVFKLIRKDDLESIIARGFNRKSSKGDIWMANMKMYEDSLVIRKIQIKSQ